MRHARAEDASRPQRFDKRIEEWILGLRDQAEEHTPEVLDGLAATAKSVAKYLDDMAVQVRQKRSTKEGAQDADEPALDKARDRGASGQVAEGPIRRPLMLRKREHELERGQVKAHRRRGLTD